VTAVLSPVHIREEFARKRILSGTIALQNSGSHLNGLSPRVSTEFA
jgi:hypothetical protein